MAHASMQIKDVMDVEIAQVVKTRRDVVSFFTSIPPFSFFTNLMSNHSSLSLSTLHHTIYLIAPPFSIYDSLYHNFYIHQFISTFYSTQMFLCHTKNLINYTKNENLNLIPFMYKIY